MINKEKGDELYTESPQENQCSLTSTILQTREIVKNLTDEEKDYLERVKWVDPLEFLEKTHYDMFTYIILDQISKNKPIQANWENKLYCLKSTDLSYNVEYINNGEKFLLKSWHINSHFSNKQEDIIWVFAYDWNLFIVYKNVA